MFCRTELGDDCRTAIYYNAAGEVQSFGIFPAQADKGSALALVFRKLKIRSDAVLAIGDHNNDIRLFAQAGVKVVVGNATVALKNQADLITPDHDGVGWAIEPFIL